ncbi:hypothetical protein AMQ84_00780 [Paenibacillus riograndensis]|uniref:Radical SAM core domain-containing protein n=1 Tax=Paenibacillus riograndensis TaxID=483937 RepID=A0A132UC54_9BACL|nr:radical SAM protein [Paenibacillus riograndensis]KWX81160.1 hypothetical protein AMQ84_00780 [Paenibacillus riograndensis]
MNVENYNRNLSKLDFYLKKYNARHTYLKGTPLIISFLVTNKCNLRCKHCFYHETIDTGNVSEALTIDEYRRLSLSMDNFLTGIFCGGEPFLREDFHEIIQIFQKNNKMMLADSASNGQYTNRIVSQVEKILKASPKQTYSLGLSLDGFRDTHNEIRGLGTFDKVLETWAACKTLKRYYSNFELYICSAMNTINENEMSAFIDWAMLNMKPDKISLIKTRQEPRAGDEIKDINMDNYLSCIKTIEKYTQQLDSSILEKPQTYLLSSVNNYIFDGEYCNEKLFTCYAGLHGGFIDYNGNIGVCEVLPTIGNLRDHNMNFKELWNTYLATERRNEVNCNQHCLHCTHESEGLLPSIYFPPNSLKYERIKNRPSNRSTGEC